MNMIDARRKPGDGLALDVGKVEKEDKVVEH